MKKLLFTVMACLLSNINYAQCDLEFLEFNWETTTATIAINNYEDCEEITGLTLYLGNSDLNDIPPCGNFSQNINWPEYTFTFFFPEVINDTITVNIFDAWNNAIANPYTIAECWVQLYEEGFFCDGGEVGIWQINVGPPLGEDFVTFNGPCPTECDTIYIELPQDTIEIIIDNYITDTLYIDNYIYLTDTIEIINETTIYVTDTIEITIDNYIYVTDTINITEYTIQYIDCDTGEPCEDGGGVIGCIDNSIFVPNAFTPNNDGINDTFYAVTDEECWDSWKLTIFNRWGGIVWESSLVNDFWQGQSRSGHWLVPDGVYTWSIRADGVEISGHVTVFR